MGTGAPERPATLVDRQREWSTLARCLLSGGPELVFVVGRRRGGKTFLLTRLVRAGSGVYYQATRKTAREQLAEFSSVVGRRFGDAALEHVSFRSWEDGFEYLARQASADPLLVVLDEFPYLSGADPALPSVLQKLWDHLLPETSVKLVLCGSYVSAMSRLERADQPLYGRRTARVRVGPFDYLDAARFVPGWSARDRMLAWGIFGGLPGHLRFLDPARSLAHNVAQRILDADSVLHDEGAHVFDGLVGDPSVHASIVEAIATGNSRWNRIATRVGKRTGSMQRPMAWLQEMGVVARTAPVTEGPRPNPKRLEYALTDPFLRFWHRTVAGLRAQGLTALVPPNALWQDRVAPRLDDLAGPVFEEACRAFVARGAHPRLPFAPHRVGSWWTYDHREELDLVALGPGGQMLVGECKWGGAGPGDLARLRRRVDVLRKELPAAAKVTLALFSGREPDPEAPADDQEDVLRFSLEDLYSTAGSPEPGDGW